MSNIDALNKCVHALRWAMEREADYPSRPQIRKKLEVLEQGAHAILDALEDVRMSELIWGADDWLAAVGIAGPLREMIAKIEQIKQKNTPRQGLGRLYTDAADGPSASELCGLIVGVHWQQTKGDWPGQRNVAANELCEQLWIAAGGARHGPARDEPFWRPYLNSAKRFAPPHVVGRHVAGLLSP